MIFGLSFSLALVIFLISVLLFLRVCLGWNQRQEDVCYLGTACQADSRKAILWARIHAPARQSLHHHLLQRLLPRRFARMRIKREDIFSRSSTLRLRLAYRVRCEHLSPSSRLQPQELSKAHRHRQYSIGLPLNLLSFSLTCIEHHSGTRNALVLLRKDKLCRTSAGSHIARNFLVLGITRSRYI